MYFLKKRFFLLRRSIAPKPFVVERWRRRHICAQITCAYNAEDRMCLRSTQVVLEFFLVGESEKKKSSFFHIKCQNIFSLRVSRFSLTARDARMSPAYDGIRQYLFAGPEIASRVLEMKGGSVKKMQNLTLSLNCAETVRPSEMMPETKNMHQCTGRRTVKTASLHVKRLIL